MSIEIRGDLRTTCELDASGKRAPPEGMLARIDRERCPLPGGVLRDVEQGAPLD